MVVEIVEFKTFPKMGASEFIQIVDFLETNFHSKQSGFIATELAKGKEENQWVMIQH